MPTISNPPVQSGDQYVIRHDNTATTTATGYTFANTQDTVNVFNQGHRNIIATANGTRKVIEPNDSEKFNDVYSITIQATQQSQSFRLEGRTKVSSQLAEIKKSTKPANTIVLLGDSITAQNGTYVDNANVEASGYFNWANALLNQRFKILKNSGIGGERTDQMLARLDADVLSYSSAWCMVLGGTNDIGQDKTADEAFVNLKTIYQKLFDNGIKVIGATVTPANNINSALRKTQYFKLNKLIRDYALENPNFILVDFASAYVDPNSAYPNAIANATSDGIHPSSYGAALMGKVLADVLQNHIPSVPIFTNSNNDVDVRNPNAMVTGTGGTLGTNITGSVAANWSTLISGAGSAVGSKVARTDGMPSEWQQFVISGGDTVTELKMYHVATTGYTVGEKYNAMAEIELDGDCTNIRHITVTAETRDSTSGIIASAHSLFVPSSAIGLTYNPRKFVLKSNPIVVQANSASVRIWVNVRMSSGTVRIGRAELRKI